MLPCIALFLIENIAKRKCGRWKTVSVSWFMKDGHLCPISSPTTFRLHLILKLCLEILNPLHFQAPALPTSSLKRNTSPSPYTTREAVHLVRKSMGLKWSQGGLQFQLQFWLSGWYRTNYFQTSIVRILVWNLIRSRNNRFVHHRHQLMAETMSMEDCPRNIAIYGMKKEQRNPDENI